MPKISTAELSKKVPGHPARPPHGPPPDLLRLRLLPRFPRPRLHPPRRPLARPGCLRYGWRVRHLPRVPPPPQSRAPPPPTRQPRRVPMALKALRPPLGCGTKGRRSCGPATARCCRGGVRMVGRDHANQAQQRRAEQGIEQGGVAGTSVSQVSRGSLESTDKSWEEGARVARKPPATKHNANTHKERGDCQANAGDRRGSSHAGSFTIALPSGLQIGHKPRLEENG